MQLKLFLITAEEASNPTNIGAAYALKNKSAWIDVTDFSAFLTVGFMKGSDFVYHNDKVYMIKKSLTIPSEKTTVFICEESLAGCDKIN